MNIEVKIKTDKVITIDYLLFGEKEDRVIVDWIDSQYETDYVYGKGVYFNEMKGSFDEVRFKKLTGLSVFDVKSNEEMDWIEIESVIFFDENEKYEVPAYLLQKFQRHDIHHKNVNLNLTEEQYQALAEYVRISDKVENVSNAFKSFFSDNSSYENVHNFLLADLKDRPKIMAEDFNVGEYTGEDEIRAINKIINERGGMAVYTLISNKGTEDECENDVLLMTGQANLWSENIRERDNGVDMQLQAGDIELFDVEEQKVDLFYVDEIRFKEHRSL